jgi:hypothetical protein
MSVTALPGAVLSIRLGSPERIGRLSIPDEASLSGLGVHSRSGPKPIWLRRQPTLINLSQSSGAFSAGDSTIVGVRSKSAKGGRHVFD